MKLFLDTANLHEIQKAAVWGIVDGITTNPSLIAKEGNSVQKQIALICELIDGDVSASVLSGDTAGMIREGRELAGSHPNVVVKCPMTEQGIQATAALAKERIRVNVTLCFSATQALLAAKAGAYIISPFVGRLEDIGESGTDLIRHITAIYKNYGYPTQVLAASVRTTKHVTECALAGAHIVTLPFKTMQLLFQHPLTTKGLEHYHGTFQVATV
jgi:transaldolase